MLTKTIQGKMEIFFHPLLFSSSFIVFFFGFVTFVVVRRQKDAEPENCYVTDQPIDKPLLQLLTKGTVNINLKKKTAIYLGV